MKINKTEELGNPSWKPRHSQTVTRSPVAVTVVILRSQRNVQHS